MWTVSTTYFAESFQSASSNSFKSQKVILEKPVLSAFLNQRYRDSLHEKCLYSESFWSTLSRIRSESGKIRTRITPNTDNSYAVIISAIHEWIYNFNPYETKTFASFLKFDKYNGDVVQWCFLSLLHLN